MSRSPWQSPIVLVPLKNGGHRLTVDFRGVNGVTVKDPYSMPWNKTLGLKYFSKLDMLQGYFQVGLAPQDAAKTAFATTSGKYQFKRLPQGMCNSPARYQRMIDAIITGPLREFCCLYIDDLLVFSETFEEDLEHIQAVLHALADANLRAHAKKCEFGLRTVTYLGHRVSEVGMASDPSKTAAITELKPPTTVKDVRSFLGITGYYRKVVKGYAYISRLLHAHEDGNYLAITAGVMTVRRRRR